jgi:predicted permease
MLWKELSYALRQLRKAPSFTFVAILTLALGIGGSTAVFTVVDSVLLKPLSYRNSGQLVVLWERVNFLGSGYVGPNPRHAAMWQDRAGSLSGLALVRGGANGVALGVTEHTRLIGIVRTAPNLLDILQVTPLLGRNFRSDDALKGHDNVAMITDSLWQSLFRGDPNVIGKTVRLAGIPREIIGVLPQSFRFPKRNVLNAFPSQQKTGGEVQEVEMLLPVPIDLNDFGWNSDYGNWLALGRLKTGITVQQAEAELNTIQEQIIREMPPDQRPSNPHNALRAYVQPMQEAVVGDYQKGSWLLLAAVGSLMLIACVNLANAQLGRAITREREAAVRSALGANQWQLLWSSLAENLLLAIAGGVAGVWLADMAVNAFRYYAPIDLPRMAEIHLNWSVLFFATILIIGSGLLFGLLPALKFLHANPQGALQSNSSRTQGTRRSRSVRSWLIGFQVFACTALLLITGLFAKSLLHLLGSDKGFDTAHVMIAEVNLSGNSYAKDQHRIAFDDAVLDKLRTLPVVQSAGLVSAMPLEGETWIDGIFRTDRPNNSPPLSNMRWISPGYFETIREKLVAGRLFEDRDRNEKTAIISGSAAKAAWPGENPIGRQIQWRDVKYTVIGIVRDARNNSLKLPQANMVYLLYTVLPPYSSFFLVRSTQPPDRLAASMRKVIWDYDPTATIARIKSLDSQVSDSLAPERFHTLVLVAFGTAALFLAMLGIYGVLSYTVATRKQEIGVRMALGATRQRIHALTMSEVTIPVLAGLLGGWAASLLIGRVVRTLLYGVKKPTEA